MKFGKKEKQTTKLYHPDTGLLAVWKKIIDPYSHCIWTEGITDKPFFPGESEVISLHFILPFISKLTRNHELCNCNISVRTYYYKLATLQKFKYLQVQDTT